MPIQLPRTIGELLANPKAVREAFELLRRLENLRIVTTDNTTRPILFSPDNAIIDLNAVSAPPPLDFTAPEPEPPAPTYEAETMAWQAAVIAAGGTLASDSLTVADAFVVSLNASTFGAKVLYVLPLLGANIAAATVPLIDRLTAGKASNSGFADADFSQATGLQGGAGKRLEIPVKPSQLGGAEQRGGLGVVELNTTRTGSSTYVLGCEAGSSPTESTYALQLHASIDVLYWGDGDAARWAEATAQPGGFHYGQRSGSSLLRLYRDGVTRASYTSTYAPTLAADRNFYVGGLNGAAGATYSDTRLGLALLTDGTLTDAEVGELSTMVSSLMTAAGR